MKIPNSVANVGLGLAALLTISLYMLPYNIGLYILGGLNIYALLMVRYSQAKNTEEKL